MSGPALRVSCAAIDIAEVDTVEQLLGPVDVAAVFTPRERRLARAGRGVESWAGRLAAKRAVAAMLGLEPNTERLAEIEIVPRIDGCRAGGLCDRGHPPIAVLHGGSRARSTATPVVTVSHVPSLAIALAVAPYTASAPAALGPTSWHIGLDVVDLHRVRRWIEHDQPDTSRRLLTDRERAWSDDSVEGLAACLALKESAVKVVGRRPPGTTWHDVAVSPIRFAPSEGHAFARAAARAVDAQKLRFAKLRLDGPIAHALAALDEGRATASVAQLAGAWCTTERHMIGIAWLGRDSRPRDDTTAARACTRTPRRE